MTKQPNECSKDIEAKRAFMRKMIEVYNVPMDLVRYESLVHDGNGVVIVDET